MPKHTAAEVTRAKSLGMIPFGVISFFASILYDSYVMVSVGLGLAFWGRSLVTSHNHKVRKT